MEFDAPKGFEMPEDATEGDTFDAVATIKVGEDGKLMLLGLDGSMFEEPEEEDEGEEEEGEKPRGGFLASAEEGIAQMMGG